MVADDSPHHAFKEDSRPPAKERSSDRLPELDDLVPNGMRFQGFGRAMWILLVTAGALFLLITVGHLIWTLFFKGAA